MKKLSKTGAELKNSVAYIKKRVLIYLFFDTRLSLELKPPYSRDLFNLLAFIF